MAQLDPKYDYTPFNTWGTRGRGASVAQLRATLLAYNSTSYSNTRLDGMTKIDMTGAVKFHGLTLQGV
jgi:hypothetical protein